MSPKRPGIAPGVLFTTQEDETGFVNVVVWNQIRERYGLLIKTTNFLGVTGRIQRQEGILHLIAESFWDPQPLIHVRLEPTRSRDFQ